MGKPINFKRAPAWHAIRCNGNPSMNTDLLIVDDDVAVCDSLKVVLELNDYDVHTCRDARRAIAIIGATPVSLAIIDSNMPNVSGARATELIRELSSEILIIGISAEANREEEMRSAGANAFLAKPLDMDRLNQTIDHLLEGDVVA